jgi:hypothetical protein
MWSPVRFVHIRELVALLIAYLAKEHYVRLYACLLTIYRLHVYLLLGPYHLALCLGKCQAIISIACNLRDRFL